MQLLFNGQTLTRNICYIPTCFSWFHAIRSHIYVRARVWLPTNFHLCVIKNCWFSQSAAQFISLPISFLGKAPASGLIEKRRTKKTEAEIKLRSTSQLITMWRSFLCAFFFLMKKWKKRLHVSSHDKGCHVLQLEDQVAKKTLNKYISWVLLEEQYRAIASF